MRVKSIQAHRRVTGAMWATVPLGAIGDGRVLADGRLEVGYDLGSGKFTAVYPQWALGQQITLVPDTAQPGLDGAERSGDSPDRSISPLGEELDRSQRHAALREAVRGRGERTRIVAQGQYMPRGSVKGLFTLSQPLVLVLDSHDPNWRCYRTKALQSACVKFSREDALADISLARFYTGDERFPVQFAAVHRHRQGEFVAHWSPDQGPARLLELRAAADGVGFSGSPFEVDDFHARCMVGELLVPGTPRYLRSFQVRYRYDLEVRGAIDRWATNSGVVSRSVREECRDGRICAHMVAEPEPYLHHCRNAEVVGIEGDYGVATESIQINIPDETEQE